MLEKTLESPLHSEDNKPANPKGNKPWIAIGRTDAEAEVPILWAPDAKSRLIWKDPDAWKDWGQEEKGMTKDKMVGWHHWLNGYEFEQAPRVSDGQGSLACCSPWDNKKSDTIEQLNWTEWLYLTSDTRLNLTIGYYNVLQSTVHGVLKLEYWSGLSLPSPVDHILSELSIVTCPS